MLKTTVFASLEAQIIVKTIVFASLETQIIVKTKMHPSRLKSLEKTNPLIKKLRNTLRFLLPWTTQIH